LRKLRSQRPGDSRRWSSGPECHLRRPTRSIWPKRIVGPRARITSFSNFHKTLRKLDVFRAHLEFRLARLRLKVSNPRDVAQENADASNDLPRREAALW